MCTNKLINRESTSIIIFLIINKIGFCTLKLKVIYPFDYDLDWFIEPTDQFTVQPDLKTKDKSNLPEIFRRHPEIGTVHC